MQALETMPGRNIRPATLAEFSPADFADLAAWTDAHEPLLTESEIDAMYHQQRETTEGGVL